jgi:hypothetical protein
MLKELVDFKDSLPLDLTKTPYPITSDKYDILKADVFVEAGC